MNTKDNVTPFIDGAVAGGLVAAAVAYAAFVADSTTGVATVAAIAGVGVAVLRPESDARRARLQSLAGFFTGLAAVGGLAFALSEPEQGHASAAPVSAYPVLGERSVLSVG